MRSRHPFRGRWPTAAATGVVLVGAAAGAWLLRGPGTGAQDASARFLAQHWQRPLLPQGPVPAGFSALEASLDPRACGQCHVAQFGDWAESLHSQTMTAGVQWQLRLMPQAEANRCLDCHAPLAEQKALTALAHNWQGAPVAAPPEHVPATLSHQGLVCASCHVRGHQRFGPGKRGEDRGAPHGGFTASAAFKDSRFCSSCHQFPEDGPRTNGKLREDTWRQWEASPQAASGQSCQSCHMPDGRHQWQGIHSPEMVRKALTTSLSVSAGRVTATLTNTGAGHYFPTYMVPKLTAQLVLVGEVDTLLAERIIGWDVDVSLEQERFDSRLPPGEGITMHADLPASAAAARQVELRLQVAPREHYERSFGEVLAQADQLDSETLGLLLQARDEAVATRFEALRVVATLPVAAPAP